MIDRRTLLSAVALLPAAVMAQSRRFRIGWLVFGARSLGPIDQSLIDALSDRGLAEGRNLEIVYRYASDTAALPGLAAELAGEKPDVLVGIGGDVAAALFNASNGKTPVVGGVSDNPVRTGLAASLARRGRTSPALPF